MSTTTSTTTPAKPQHRKTPAWVNMSIVGLILLAGSWAIWQFGFKSPAAIAKPRMETLANARGFRGVFGGGAGRMVMNNQPRAPRNNDELRVNAKTGDIRGQRGDLVFSVTKTSKGETRIYLDSASRERWVGRDDYKLHILTYNLVNTSRMARDVGLSDAQKSKLDAYPYNIVLTPAEETTLKSAFAAYPAKQDDAEKAKLYATLDEVAKTHLPKLEASFKARVKAIPTILTADQLTKARNWATTPSSPATRPSTANVAKLPE